jgi:hypothetical protein
MKNNVIVISEAQVMHALKEKAPPTRHLLFTFAEEDHKPGQTADFMNLLPSGFDMCL